MPVPGCTADLTLENDNKAADFCIVREDYNKYQLQYLGAANEMELLVCEGDCDSDDDVRPAFFFWLLMVVF